MNRTRIILAFLAPIALILTACGVNAIPTSQENAKAKWADLQAAYQRRLDTLPSLAQTVTASGAHENNLQVGVAQARAGARAAQVTPDQLTDPAAMQRFQEAQRQVSNLIIQVTQEATPENRANENYATLMQQIEGANNRITIAIRDYNEAVRAYNTRIRTFPDVIGARVIYGSQPMVPFEAAAGSNVAPTLNFGNQQ
jgi:LemA protein